jgi:hypothetical protein
VDGKWVKAGQDVIKLKNNYDIWQLFGGYNSLTLKGNKDTSVRNFELSENSMK